MNLTQQEIRALKRVLHVSTHALFRRAWTSLTPSEQYGYIIAIRRSA